MKQILALMVVCVSLIGCAPRTVVKTEVVTVDKPIPYCPAPPQNIPEVDLLVDTLTDADANNPGKVGLYYKHDMYYLRKRNELLNLILQQYQSTSADMDKIKEQVDQIFADIDKANKDLVERLKTDEQ